MCAGAGEAAFAVPQAMAADRVSGYAEASGDDISRFTFGALVLDEATAIKGFRSKRSKKVKELAKGIPIRFALTGTPNAALWCFAAFYAVCILVTWWYYARKNAEMPC